MYELVRVGLLPPGHSREQVRFVVQYFSSSVIVYALCFPSLPHLPFPFSTSTTHRYMYDVGMHILIPYSILTLFSRFRISLRPHAASARLSSVEPSWLLISFTVYCALRDYVIQARRRSGMHMAEVHVGVKYRIRIWIYETKSVQNFKIKKRSAPNPRSFPKDIHNIDQK